MAGSRLWPVFWLTLHLSASTVSSSDWVVDSPTQLDSLAWPGRSWTKDNSEDSSQEHSAWDTRNALPFSQRSKSKGKVLRYNSSSIVSAIVKKRKSGTVIFKSPKDNERISGRSIVKNRNGSLKLPLLPNQLGSGMGGSVVDSIEVSENQKFATEPAPQTAVNGSTVVLPCRVINKVGHLQWTKDGFGLGNERHLYGFARYSMIGSDDEGDFSLRIRPVLLSDDGIFQCQVSASDGVPGIRSKAVQLKVYVPPAPPVVEPIVLQTTAELPSTIVCISKGGRPPPEIQWVDNKHPRVPIGLGAETKIDLMPDNKRSIVTSTLSFTPRRTHDNSTITCVTSHQALSSPLSSSVSLRVQFAPEVQVSGNPARLVEGDDAIFVCKATANPPLLKYRWYHNGMVLANQSAQTLTLPRISRDMHEDSIACEVSNKVGTSKKALILQVRYAPAFRSRPLDKAEELGNEVVLKCDVDANPSASIVWLQEGEDKIIGTGPELKVVVTPASAGSYRCVAGVRNRDLQFPELVGKLKVMVKGPPTIVSSAEQSGRPGGTVKLECISVSVPSPIKVTWTYKGRPIDLDDDRFEIVEEHKSEGLRNILVIHGASETDFGDYNCSVVNEYGIARKLIRLNEEKRIPMLLLMGGVGAFIVIIVVVTSFVLCNKRGSRDKGSPVPEKIVSASSPTPNMYSSSSDARVTDRITPPETITPHEGGATRGGPGQGSSENEAGSGGSCGNHTLELTRNSRMRDPILIDRTSTFTSNNHCDDDHSVYHPLMSIADHEALMRRGSLSEMTSSGAGAPYTPPTGPMMSESHMAPDFCTIRRGARGPDITLGFPNTEITITGTRMNGDGLPNGNGIKHPINDRYSPYVSYTASPPPPPYPRAPFGSKAGAPPHSGGGASMGRVNGSPMTQRSSVDRRQESDYIFSSDAVMKPGTLV